MRLSIVVLFVAVHVVLAYPHHQYRSTSDDCFSDGFAQGNIRYIDANGAQRLVTYNYPKPIYNVQQLSSNGQLYAGNPFLKSGVQPIYAGPEYQYQGSNEEQAAREQHFRAWNSQRYQALKNEADKMYAEGKIPSSDMLARLQQLEEYSENTMKQAREEHWKLWNEARSNVLNSQVIPNNEHQQARDAHLRLYDQQLRLIQSYDHENSNANLRAGNEFQAISNVHSSDGRSSKSAIAQPAGSLNKISQEPVAQNIVTSHAPILKSAEVQLGQIAGFANRIGNEPSQVHGQAYQGKFLIQSPVIQGNEAKIQAEKFQSIEQSNVLSTPAVKTATSETSLNQVIGSVFQQPETQKVYEKEVRTDADALQEKAELEAEKLREMERLREEEKRIELDALKEAERLREEKKQMEAEQMNIQAMDQARLQKDLKEQFDGERVRNIATEIVTPSGIYYLANRYKNPFFYQYNTPAAAVRFAADQVNYLGYPGAQAYALHASGQQQQSSFVQPSFVYNEKPAAVKFIPQQYLPAEQIHQAKENKDLYELEKATREHFHAHEIALKQLDVANQKAALADCAH